MDNRLRKRWREAVVGGPEEQQRALGRKLLPDRLRSYFAIPPRRPGGVFYDLPSANRPWVAPSGLHFDPRGWPITLYWWSEHFKHNLVCSTRIADGIFISTVYLGTDHSWRRDGPPLIFESMVFDNDEDRDERECERYPNVEEARAGHEEIVARLSVKRS